MNIIRLILFYPAAILGGLFGVLANVLFTVPLTIASYLGSTFSLGVIINTILGENTANLLGNVFDELSGGFFTAIFFTFLGVAVFPYEKYRRITAVLLSVILIYTHSNSQRIISAYSGEMHLLYFKIVGITTGALTILYYINNAKTVHHFSVIDRLFQKNTKQNLESGPNS